MTQPDEYDTKDIEAVSKCCDLQRQKTDSFSTLGKSDKDKKNAQKTHTHSV